ncbi:MAG: hypothetical protein ABI824_11780, partial [Acidobacteriota bacterium]
MWVKNGLKSVLAVLGKSDKKVAAVFGISPKPCHDAVMHLKAGAPGVPVWLFSLTEPPQETRILCERVFVNRYSLALFLQAQVRLWPYCVAIAVGTWTAEHGRWAMKLAPFLIPPFRVVLLNSWGGFFPGKPALILLHWHRFLLGAALSLWIRLTEIGIGCLHSGPVRRIQDVTAGCWRLVAYHVWRSGPVRRAGDISSSFLLFVVAKLMTWFSFPHRRWFKSIHGDDFVRPEERTAGRGVAKFVQQGSVWDVRGFSDFVDANEVRWIHWQQGEQASSIQAELEASRLFDDPRTFAVARQSEARGWKSSLFPMAPFRHLQKGTASQVMAPLSSSIWVDRAKLAALGVPHTQLTDTAWMLLFWKAAAAGWCCYSLPGEQQAGAQPDFPAQETEFFLRLCADPELRRLGPTAPDLSRGTISFSPDQQLPMRPGCIRVLVVSPFLPFPLAHGGAVRIFNLCSELADRVDFILVAIREAHDTVHYEELHRVFRHVYTVDLDEHESTDERIPKQVRAAQSSSLRTLIADVTERLQPDLRQIEFTHMAGYRDCASGVPALL